MATKRRILKELEDMSRDRSSGMQAEVVDSDNMMHLRGWFEGPPDTPYAGGTYVVDIVLPDNYPFVPPKMRFETRVWHPNISSQTGAICLDTLSAKWSPVLTIKTALLSLQSLLAAPEPSDPQDAEVAQMMLNDPARFDAKAREWATRYAGAGDAAPPSEAEKRRRELDGYSESLVEGFTGMGFETRAVVSALRGAGVKRGVESLAEDMAGRVVERLIGGM
ncbi:ubiquitin-conjugating enzyme/RWD-like protein [Sphaerosporella brunnea]|uniref:Ubiquitin-conjugating enzyme E2 1 n=1 Tax=Sphaerosporella brunnea TaxID=1250544 RepID=A0A5J5F192_9PEZI|nr:ubiquitin-conjugating enzyme/RWD-like protein [Sphaerosporella brunnea]